MADTEPDATALRPRWANTETVRVAAYLTICVAGSWWILGELAAVLRPLLLATFLGYVLMPYYSRLRHKLPAPIAIGLLASLTTAGLVGLALAIYGSLLGLTDELPQIKLRLTEFVKSWNEWVASVPYVGRAIESGKMQEDQIAERVATAALKAVNLAAGGLLEAAAAGLYLLFLLLESARFPARIRAAYPQQQAEQILDVFGRINSAIISYLKAKVFASLVLAVPVGLILTGFGVRFALLWAVLTFACNFIPYLGSVMACGLPVLFSFVQFDFSYQSITVAILLVACHVLSATLAEPTIIGRAVGLSPLVILAALSVWGLLWGLPGMFLAVPLTVVLKIVFENIAVTRPIARMLSGG